MESEPSPLEKLNKLTRGHGSLQPGRGMASGVLALTLAGLALLGVIGFHFPAYTSTPELRAQYDVQTLRYLLFGGMVLSGVISVANLVLGRARWLAVWSFAFLGVAQLLGGATVVPERRFALDGKWDVGVGLWFE